MLYQIHRYPADLIDVAHLRDGRRVLIRPVLPQDEELTSAFFGSLPAHARHARFLAPVRSLPPDLVKRFTNVDYTGHLALVAEVFADDGETVVAEARYVRDGDDPAAAEFAVSVAEAWQGQGLAATLLAKLLRQAARTGIVRVVGETLAGNEPMLHLARKAGFRVTASKEVRGLVVLEKELTPAASHPCGEDEARSSLPGAGATALAEELDIRANAPTSAARARPAGGAPGGS